MSSKSNIEWTESTWNPVTGCTKVSPGCKFCYAEKLAKRLKAMGVKNYEHEFKLTLQPQMLSIPYSWKKPKVVFVNSMSDLFHEKIPLEYLKKVFEVMNDTPQHTYQILTKRDSYLAKIAPELSWSRNIWMGVTVESQEYVSRIDNLRKVPAAIRFLSIEPLISEITNIDFTGIDWVVVGGESGPKARPMKKHWVDFLLNECNRYNVPFFFKQWGGKNKKKAGRLLDGRTHDAMPRSLSIL